METLLQFREEAEQRAPGYRHRIHGLCIGLTVIFARASEMSMRRGAGAGQRLTNTGYYVAKIKSYLRKRLHQPARLGAVAQFLGLSEEHVARLLKGATGLTVSKYVRRLRVAEAKSRLAATDENLSEIARKTGFASLTVFSRNFTREAGMSPSEYRRQMVRHIHQS